ELSVTVEGLLNIWTSDGNNALQGTLPDLERNIRDVAEVADLTREELDWLLAQIPTPGSSGPQRGGVVSDALNSSRRRGSVAAGAGTTLLGASPWFRLSIAW